ncbi:MAG: SRPBCC family protein [Alcanivoracaceae bacterium]|nr:SRPBCC family protein [Alcanivoracaceae bacterium]
MKIRTEFKVSVPAERAWEVIAEKFGDAAEWAATLESTSLKGSLGVGAIRTCRTKGVGPFPPATIEERLIDFDSKQLRYTYVVESGLPAIFKSAQNTWSVESISETSCIIHTLVIAKLNFWLRPLEWLFPLLLKRDLKKTFEELSHFIEQGKPHPRKVKSISKRAKI